MASTLENFLKNKNIKADRFAMAAISYIFKAFGDNIRSKEYWPWGDKVNFPWGDEDLDNLEHTYTLNVKKDNEKTGKSEIIPYTWPPSGNLSDLTRAMICIKEAQSRSQIEQETEKIEIKQNNSNNINNLKKRLDRINMGIKTVNRITKNVNDTSIDYQEKTNNIRG